MREDAFFQTHHKHRAKLQALGRMKRHEIHDILLFADIVLIAHERYILQELLQAFGCRHIIIFFGEVDELLYVFPSLFGVIRHFCEMLAISDGAQEVFEKLRSTLRTCLLRQALHERMEIRERRGRIFGYARDCRTRGLRAVQGKVCKKCLVADAPRGHIDDALQSHEIVAVECGADVRQDIFYFAALVKPHAADDLVGDSAVKQGFFHRAGLCVGAVEHDDIAESASLLREMRDGVCDKRRFLPLVGECHDADTLARVLVRYKTLVFLHAVFCDHAARRVQDRLGGAIVAVKHDDARVRPVAFKIEDVAVVGSAE